MNWLRRLFCRHPALAFIRNIYGDEINERGGKRSLWQCKRCGSVIAMDRLNPPSEAPTTSRPRVRVSGESA